MTTPSLQQKSLKHKTNLYTTPSQINYKIKYNPYSQVQTKTFPKGLRLQTRKNHLNFDNYWTEEKLLISKYSKSKFYRTELERGKTEK